MTNPPNTNFPLGSKVRMLDAWGRNPVVGRVTAHYGVDQVRVEDTRGVVHTGQTWRVSAVPAADDFSLEDMLA